MHRANNAQTTRCLLFAHGTRGRVAAALIRHSRVSAAAVETVQLAAVETVQLAAQALLYTRPVVRVLQGSGLTTTHCSKCCWRQPRTALSAMCAFVRHKPSAASMCRACNTSTPVMQQRTLHVASRVAHGKRADSADRSLPMSYHTATHARSHGRSGRSLTRAIFSSPNSGSSCLPALLRRPVGPSVLRAVAPSA